MSSCTQSMSAVVGNIVKVVKNMKPSHKKRMYVRVAKFSFSPKRRWEVVEMSFVRVSCVVVRVADVGVCSSCSS